MANGPYDPMEGDTDWGTTGYGTGDPKANSWIDKFGNLMPYIVGGIFAADPVSALFHGTAAAGAGAGANAAASGGAGTLATTAVPSMPWTIPASVMGDTAGVIPGVDLGAGGLASLAGAGGGGSGILNTLKNYFTGKNGVKDVAGLAALLPMLASRGGGSNNPFADLNPQLAATATDALNLQKSRMQQAQPIYDALVSQAYGTSPMRYRGAAPANYPAAASAPVSGPYAYRTPSFG